MAKVYLSLGSNLGDRRDNLQNALRRINTLENTEIKAISSVYETDPVGYFDQNRFYNIAAEINTAQSPSELLSACQKIEKEMGRVKHFVNGPRNIDIDILTYDDVTVNSPQLQIPHPRMMERAFVLMPLCEICDEERYRKALSDIGKNGVVKTEQA